ncbi:DUF1361 domain-containing protein [Paenibacillus sp. CGMCC 1.16610]|uniref:DUF1361 domain-containing protein n=1 Tax=Paenibacillus anseongense TaxID=2682845 RepID=A0ABW9UFS9_9BACL|nr:MULTISPECIES: DUF1361 domain-containing protein [Paenibacillus]MBA2943992.1 DUF1361 domain-containing protein [Paenibacillus sp. CGMCC 1.16610]MVQ37881.1 DUF1361 domain-containing protein [Paenibacillus anseongense]
MKTINHWVLQLLLALLSLSTIGIYLIFKNQTYFEFLNWNLFLAWIPNFFALLAYLLHLRRPSVAVQLLTFIFGLAWLLFLPNAPYIITDFIHLTLLKDLYITKKAWSMSFWNDFFTIFLYAWNGLLLGCSSMYMIHLILMKHWGHILSWFLMILTSLLSGYGILLGREYRLNSWDALLSLDIVDTLQKSIHKEAIIFCVLVGFVILAMYATFYLLINGIGSSKVAVYKR